MHRSLVCLLFLLFFVFIKAQDFRTWVEKVDAKVNYFTLEQEVKAAAGGDVHNLSRGTKIIRINDEHYIVRPSDGLVHSLAISRHWEPTATHLAQIAESVAKSKEDNPSSGGKSDDLHDLVFWARKEQASITLLKFEAGVCTEVTKVNGEDGSLSYHVLLQDQRHHGLLKVELSKKMQPLLQESKKLDPPASTTAATPNKAPDHSLPDPDLAGLRRFIQEMESWSASSTPSAKMSLMTAQQALQSFVVQNLRDFEIRPNVILLMGDQSSGKSTTAIALTGQVVFYVDPKTGTKARTLITVTYKPELKEILATFQYKNQVHRNLSPGQLAKVMDTTFHDSPIDAENLASVNIQLKEPSFGVSIVDHPGIVINDVESTLAASRLSLRQYFQGDSSSQSIVLLCQTAATWDLSAAGWLKLREDLQYVPEGNLFFAITRMDELTVSSVATGMINSKNYPANAVTPLQVLEYMKADVRKHLGRNAQIFFVSSSSSAWETLQEKSPEQRWTEFQRSQETNQKKMLHRLQDVDEWNSNGITLNRMTAKQREEFDQQLEMKNLLAALLMRQHEGTLQLAIDIENMVEKRKKEAWDSYLTLREQIHQAHDLPELVLQFWKNLTTHYHALTVQPSYTDSQTLSFNAHYTRLEKNLGYTLEEELALYNLFSDRGEFPPPDRRIPEYEEVVKTHQSAFVRPAELKLPLLPHLIRRMQAEFAFRTQLIQIPELNAKDIQRAGTGGGALQTFDLKEALSNKVAAEFAKIYGSAENGGNKVAAIRAGMAFLGHAQTVATVLCNMEEYFPLLQREGAPDATSSRDDTSAHRVLDLFANAPLFSKHQRNKLSPPNVDHVIHDFVRLDDLYKDYQRLHTNNQPVGSGLTGKLRRKPRDDLIYVLIAKYFDSPVESIRSRLDHSTNALKLTQPAFIASSLTFAPHFIHQDKQHLKEYKETYPRDDFAQAFLSVLPPPETVPEAVVKEMEEVAKDVILEAAEPGVDTLKNLATETINAFIPHSSEQGARGHVPLDAKAPLFIEAQKVPEIGRMLRDLDRQSLPVRLDLLSSLIRQASGPDIFPQPQAAGDLNRFEHNELNYVFRRYLTAGFFEAMHETLRTIVASSFEMTNQAAMPGHQSEIYERYCSLLLGYDYPYTIPERPLTQSHLDPDHVIPFLRRNLKQLTLPLAQWDATILSDEVKYSRSPLVIKVLKMLGLDQRPEDVDNGDARKDVDVGKVNFLVQSLYEAHKRRYDRDHFHKLLILELVPERYPLFSLQEIQQHNMKRAEASLDFWQTADIRLGEFIAFVRQHGAKFGSLHDIPPSVNSLKPTLSAVGVAADRRDPFQQQEEPDVIMSI